ncbi:MAG: M12 family metallo-peptidase, partial [Saprospiraceae bacterium]|nr:M12 family metallo-peptidase [Saprospiraceae bacterium]
MKKFLLFCLLALASPSFAQSLLWQQIPESDIPAVGQRYIVPAKYQTMWLNLNALQTLLTDVPERFTPATDLSLALPVFTLPTPDGRLNRFRLTESPVMAPELQAQYPGIRCYTGYGLDDPTAFLKCDLTPQGFHAMVLSDIHGPYFVDPYSFGDRENYVVYYKKDYPLPAGKTLACTVEGRKPQDAPDPWQTPDQGSCQLRRYRLAVAATGEYTINRGGAAAALAAINTTINRVNSVYEKELAVTLQLVANNNLIIFPDPLTDPFTNSDNGVMNGENQTVCDNISNIGTANYDIGHVFGTTGGGQAGLGVVCLAGEKGKGASGSPSPTGDPFDIDLVSHEIGHQFGGNHTFNGTSNSCGGGSRNLPTAYEPGSGTTIMAYAGICGPQNVQNNSDPYFHAASLEEMGVFTTTGAGNSCGLVINTSNDRPTVNGGGNHTITKSTPFALTATGGDPNGNAVTYNWEQRDNEDSTQPPVATNAGGPAFRTFTATTSPTRTFPAIAAVIANTTPVWEVLPSVARTMNFRVTVRDNAPAYGCTNEADVVITVANSGPFLVTAPSAVGITWTNTSETITWDPAGTAAAPVSSANVNILLSTDGGNSFLTTLIANTPNDGSEIITVPPGAAGQNNCRVRIEGAGNIFFDMSNNNFAIAAVLPVELTDFQARLENKNTALLTWSTESET